MKYWSAASFQVQSTSTAHFAARGNSLQFPVIVWGWPGQTTPHLYQMEELLSPGFHSVRRNFYLFDNIFRSRTVKLMFWSIFYCKSRPFASFRTFSLQINSGLLYILWATFLPVDSVDSCVAHLWARARANPNPLIDWSKWHTELCAGWVYLLGHLPHNLNRIESPWIEPIILPLASRRLIKMHKYRSRRNMIWLDSSGSPLFTINQALWPRYEYSGMEIYWELRGRQADWDEFNFPWWMGSPLHAKWQLKVPSSSHNSPGNALQQLQRRLATQKFIGIKF